MIIYYIISSIVAIGAMLYAVNIDKAYKREVKKIIDTLNDKQKEINELTEKVKKLKAEIIAYDLTLENFEILKQQKNAKRKSTNKRDTSDAR